jgi:hypothetical protein
MDWSLQIKNPGTAAISPNTPAISEQLKMMWGFVRRGAV